MPRKPSPLRYRTTSTPDGPVVHAPFIRDAWTARDARYWRRRVAATAAWIGLTAVAVGLAVLYVRAIARSGSTPAVVFAVLYALLVVPGAFVGRRWVAAAPGRRGNTIGYWGPTYFFLMPVAAGVGLAVLPDLVRADFLGERRARELTASWRARQQQTSERPTGAG